MLTKAHFLISAHEHIKKGKAGSTANMSSLRYNLEFKEEVPGLPADGEPVDVQERMQQANCFSHEHPEKLREIMKGVGRNDLGDEVERFISK